MARGYEELFDLQFSKVWPNISGFTMLADTISVQVSASLAWATCLFESGLANAVASPAKRKGRMTFIFELRDGRWVMVHSHDSLYRAPPGGSGWHGDSMRP